MKLNFCAAGFLTDPYLGSPKIEFPQRKKIKFGNGQLRFRSAILFNWIKNLPFFSFAESYSITSTSPIRQFNDEKRRRSQSSTLSTPNLQISSTATTTVTQQTSSQQQTTTTTLHKTSFQSSSTQLSKIEEKIQGRGMCRSSASYGIQQMLQDQVGTSGLASF